MFMKVLTKSFIPALIFITTSVFAQNPTVGLLFHDKAAADGYTLFTPESNDTVYLINNCGEKINEWHFFEQPGATCYLLENGNLLRAGRDSIQIRDWNNTIVWTYAMNANGLFQHHDIEPLPNGNVLCLLYDRFSDTTMIAEGRNPNNLNANFKLDKIVELQPVGANNANIVWEWSFIDHFIQDFDNTKANYGLVEDSPELIDLNFDNTFNSDFTHCNSIDYNSAFDQIILSARNLSEIYIIDHSTTTAEASGHSGGNSNMGGDFLWRWGNPQVYRQGTALDQKLFYQHDAKWVQPGYSDVGKISVFNNYGDTSNSFSSVHLIEPEFLNFVYTKTSNKFKPLNFDWSWDGSILGTLVLQTKKSGVQSLANGNMLICETGMSRISEITKNGKLVWSFVNPSGSSIANQFDIPTGAASIFRAEKYPPNYLGFAGQNLMPQGIIEDQNDSSDVCISKAVGIVESKIKNIRLINPARNGRIQFNQNIEADELVILSINGKEVHKQKNFRGMNLEVCLSPGLYFLQITKNNERSLAKLLMY
jgi:hypothetical protein